MEIKSLETYQTFDDNRFTKNDMIKHRHSVAFLLNFLPGQHMKPHHHPQKELYLLVLEGGGSLSIDGKEQIIKQGDVIYCHSEEKIGFTNTSDEKVSIYVTMTNIK